MRFIAVFAIGLVVLTILVLWIIALMACTDWLLDFITAKLNKIGQK